MSSFSRTSCYFSLAIHHIVFNVHVIILLYAFIFVLVNNYVTMYPLHYRSLSLSLALCVSFSMATHVTMQVPPDAMQSADAQSQFAEQ